MSEEVNTFLSRIFGAAEEGEPQNAELSTLDLSKRSNHNFYTDYSDNYNSDDSDDNLLHSSRNMPPEALVSPPIEDTRLQGGLDDDDDQESSLKEILPLYRKPAKSDSPSKHNLSPKQRHTHRARLNILSPRERALWLWANVENLDVFLQDCYDYYLQNGFWCILIKKATDMLTLGFVVYLSSYLFYCIDYSKLKSSKKLSEIQYDQCFASRFHGLSRFAVYLFYFGIAARCVHFWLVELQNLREMRLFFEQLLQIDESELQVVSWQLIVKKLVLLRDTNANGILNNDMNSKTRLTAHDVANRIMRKENFLVALYNKNVLDFEIKLPLLSAITANNNLLTKTIEWNVNLSVIGFLFDRQGQFDQAFLKESNRHKLSQELKKRFYICGAMGIVVAPLLATYFVVVNFLRFFYELRSNPHLIGNREYSPYAEWKFREYNELYHFFKKRLFYSVEPANEYLEQFPKERTNLVMKFVSFVAGALVTVLVLLSIFDPDLSINFEITENKSVLFYIGVLGTIWAVAHGATSDNDIQNRIFDPERSLREVAAYTHYLPPSWEGRFHTEDIKNEFSRLFQLKLVTMAKEFLGIIFVPFIFWFSLPQCSDQIIDFFREFTIHVDGLGYVCSFAMFDVEKTKPKKEITFKDTGRSAGKRPISSESEKPQDSESFEPDNKMLKSYLYFVESYAPDATSSSTSSLRPRGQYSKSNGVSSRRRPLQASRIDESYVMNGPTISVQDNEEGQGVLGILNNFYETGKRI